MIVALPKPDRINAYAWEPFHEYADLIIVGKPTLWKARRDADADGEFWLFSDDGRPLATVARSKDGGARWATWRLATGEVQPWHRDGWERNLWQHAPDLETAKQRAGNRLRKRGITLTIEPSPGALEAAEKERTSRMKAEREAAIEAGKNGHMPMERERARTALAYVPELGVPGDAVDLLVEFVAGLVARRLAEAEVDGNAGRAPEEVLVPKRAGSVLAFPTREG